MATSAASVAASGAAAAVARAGLYAPAGGALSRRDVARLADFVHGAAGRLLALTGAGCSTESGVPDYRSPEGSYSKGHKPMLHATFVSEPAQRARYWARSLAGWRYFAGAEPNATHRALAALEAAGHVFAIVTQNVDGLHSRAGSRRVVELHGRNDTVHCLSCSFQRPRIAYQEELELVNSAWMGEYLPAVQAVGDIRADGDAHLAHEDFRDFHVPGCPSCGGVLKPDVVFFGGALRPEVRDAALRCAEEADRLLILGSSCQVYSAFQLVKIMAAAGKPIALINIGETRADPLVPDTNRFATRCSTALEAICEELCVPVPAAE